MGNVRADAFRDAKITVPTYLPRRFRMHVWLRVPRSGYAVVEIVHAVERLEGSAALHCDEDRSHQRHHAQGEHTAQSASPAINAIETGLEGTS